MTPDARKAWQTCRRFEKAACDRALAVQYAWVSYAHSPSQATRQRVVEARQAWSTAEHELTIAQLRAEQLTGTTDAGWSLCREARSEARAAFACTPSTADQAAANARRAAEACAHYDTSGGGQLARSLHAARRTCMAAASTADARTGMPELDGDMPTPDPGTRALESMTALSVTLHQAAAQADEALADLRLALRSLRPAECEALGCGASGVGGGGVAVGGAGGSAPGGNGGTGGVAIVVTNGNKALCPKCGGPAWRTGELWQCSSCGLAFGGGGGAS